MVVLLWDRGQKSKASTEQYWHRGKSTSKKNFQVAYTEEKLVVFSCKSRMLDLFTSVLFNRFLESAQHSCATVLIIQKTATLSKM